MITLDSLEIFTLQDDKLILSPNTEKTQFKPHFNFIYGTDNSVGKSTLLECINFCLGSNARKVKSRGIDPQLFCCNNKLQNLYLSLTLIHQNGKTSKTSTILRNTTDNSSTIYIHYDSYLYKKYKISYPFKNETTQGLQNYKTIPNIDYRKILEQEFFNRPSDFNFNYRSLIEYSLRVAGHPWDAPYPISGDKLVIRILYLLGCPGLNWAVGYSVNEFNKLEKAVNKLILSALEMEENNFDSALDTIITNIDQEEKKLSRAETELGYIVSKSDNEELWEQLSQLKKERSSFYNQKRPLEQEFKDLEEQLKTNISAENIEEIKALLEEAGIVFSTDLMPYLESVLGFHASVLEDRKQDMLNRINFLGENIEDYWEQINNKSSYIISLENEIKESSDTQIINDVEAIIESHKSEINKLQTHKIMLQKIVEEIPKLQDYKQKEKEWIHNNKEHLDYLINEFEIWCQQVYQGEYEKKGIVLYREDTLYFDLIHGVGNAEGETTRILFDIWLLKNSPYMNFLIHDSFMFHGIEPPHIGTLFNTIIGNTDKQYIFTLNINESSLLTEEQKEFLKQNTIVTLTHDLPLFGIRC